MDLGDILGPEQIIPGMNASDRGFWQRSVANAAVAEFIKPKEDDYSILYPGGAIAGPMIKNRLFFFLSYEGLSVGELRAEAEASNRVREPS